MEPLQIFYRNEQAKAPFDIVWDLKDLSKEKFYDGLYIIDHLATYVMTWLDKLTEKKKKRGISAENAFIVKGRVLLKKVRSIGKETASLFDNIGQVIGVVDTVDPNTIQHDDQENEALKHRELKTNFVQDLIANQKKNN